ncbi:MAG: hypothetical protein ACRDUB_07305 [Mycobacterium sp.]
MAALTGSGNPARARRLVMTLLNVFAREWIAESQRSEPGVKRRRYYPPKRDRVIEDAAMSREMYRL